MRRREWAVRGVVVSRRPNLTPHKSSRAAHWHALFPSVSTLHAMPISNNERLTGVMGKDLFFFFVRGLSVMAFFVCYIYISLYILLMKKIIIVLFVCLFFPNKIIGIYRAPGPGRGPGFYITARSAWMTCLPPAPPTHPPPPPPPLLKEAVCTVDSRYQNRASVFTTNACLYCRLEPSVLTCAPVRCSRATLSLFPGPSGSSLLI